MKSCQLTILSFVVLKHLLLDVKEKVYTIYLFLGIYIFCFEFVFLRIFPKVKFFSPFYFSITRGKNRLLSKAEVLGRLMSCGFDIVDYKTIDGLLYIVSEKKKNTIIRYESKLWSNFQDASSR